METKRVSRRQFLRMMTLTAGGAVLAACGASTPATDGSSPTAQTVAGTAPAAAPAVASPVSITWWTVPSEEYSEEAQRKLLDAFKQANPNVNVDMTVLPAEGYDDKMTAALGANQGVPDVAFFWNTAWLPQALDLGSLIKTDGFDTSQYIKGFWDTRTQFNDTTIGLPLGVGANFVMYNKDTYDEMKVAYPDFDLTTDQWLKLVPQLTDESKKRWGGDRPRGPFRAIWYNMGARAFSEDNKTVDGYLNGDASVNAYAWLWDLVNTNATPTSADLDVLGTAGTGPVDLFIAKRLATATLNQGHMLNAIDAGVPFGIVREPGMASDQRWVNAWSNTIGIWKNTNQPEAAWAFLRFWGGPDGQKFLMENANLFPSISSVLQQHPKANEDYTKNFFKVLEDKQVAEFSTLPWNAPVLRAAKPVWDKVMANQITRDAIKAELDAVVPEAQKALDDARNRLS